MVLQWTFLEFDLLGMQYAILKQNWDRKIRKIIGCSSLQSEI